MEGRQKRRRLALALRAAGLALMATSLTAALLHSHAGYALAQVMPVPGLGTPVPDGTATPSPSPSPSAAAAQHIVTATPQAAVVRGGPLTFSITGTFAFGEHSPSTTRADGSSPESIVSTGLTQATNNAGLLVQLERRTGASTLTLGMPVGVSSAQRTNIGQVQAGYYTSHFGLQYMPQPLALLGAVPLGTTLAGFSLQLPISGGDISFYEGNAIGSQGSLLRLYGMRERTMRGPNLYELGLVRGASKDGTSAVDGIIGGFARSVGNLNQLLEGTIERVRGESGSSGANAFAYRLDYGGQSVYSTLTLRHISSGFSSIGGGQLNAEDEVTGAFRDGAVNLQETFDRTLVGGAPTQSRQGTYSLLQQIGNKDAVPLTLQWSFSDQRAQNASGASWLGMAGLQLETAVRNVSMLFQGQATRSTSTGSMPVGGFTYQGAISKPFGQYFTEFSYQAARQTSFDSFNTSSQTQLFLTRQWGLTALTLSETISHTISSTSDTLQTGPLLTLSRQLSPVLSLALTYGQQSTRDALNPSSNGRSRVFNVQLTAPFAIGSGLVQGRANPKLPATISGAVLNDTGSQGPFAAAVNNGVGNVTVVLDGRQMQRTDLSGRFQFNFVTPGHHSVEIDLASLPRGVTPDQPLAGIDVQGGQQGQVIFRIGTYGAVQGHVYGRDENGALVPIGGAVLTIDKTGGISTTGPDGLYGFGRLTSGTHVVAVQTASLPAMASIAPDALTQKVLVRSGEIATLDFTAQPLGSIAGFAVFDPSLAPAHAGGAYNAYVVAEPGDYAAIANEDGSFLLDNLPAGTYTVDVDPETVPEDTGNVGGAQTVTVGPGQNITGIRFVVGRKLKNIVFSLKSSESSAASISLSESVLPPGGATAIAVDAGTPAKRVTATAFGKSFALTYDKSRGRWVGMVEVPLTASAGTSAIIADIEGSQSSTTSADLKIDPSVPIATFTMTPRHPARGQYALVRARFLADVHPGTTIRWLDGQVTKLSRPITGRVYQFTVKISEQPLHGQLLTSLGELPITLR
jgi:hypothetical protein